MLVKLVHSIFEYEPAGGWLTLSGQLAQLREGPCNMVISHHPTTDCCTYMGYCTTTTHLVHFEHQSALIGGASQIGRAGYVSFIYILATSKVINGWVTTCDSVHGDFIVLPQWEIRTPVSHSVTLS